MIGSGCFLLVVVCLDGVLGVCCCVLICFL